MNMPKSSSESISYFAEIVPSDPDIVQKKMFGYPSCFVNGNLFLGLHGDDVILRLGADRLASFMHEEGAAQFEPMPGRPMKEYAVAPKAVRDDTARLAAWISEALAYARTLPPKVKKPNAKPAKSKA